MLKIEILPEDLFIIQRDRYYHPQPHIMIRMNILALHHQGENATRIGELLGRDPRTVRACLTAYQTGGLNAVYHYDKYKPESELEKFSILIEDELAKNPPQSAKEAGARIEELTGIKRSETQIREFLKKKGIHCLKTGALPAKADPVAQKEFLQNTMEPVIEEAKRGECELYYMDAAHFVMGAFLGYLWSKVRVFVRSPSGRKRYNVLGAYNPIRGVVEFVSNNGYINSQSVCDLLWNLALLHPGKKIKIILDNAAYQRCHVVRDFALELGIELIFLPSYSPNLNLIERLWKFVKKKCLYNIFYNNFEAFSQAIDECLNQTDKKYADEIKSLLTLKFQQFENIQFLAV